MLVHEKGNAFFRVHQILVKVHQPDLIYIGKKGMTGIFFKKSAEVFRGDGKQFCGGRNGNVLAVMGFCIVHDFLNPFQVTSVPA